LRALSGNGRCNALALIPRQNPLIAPIGYFLLLDWTLQPWQICAIAASAMSVILVFWMNDIQTCAVHLPDHVQRLAHTIYGNRTPKNICIQNTARQNAVPIGRDDLIDACARAIAARDSTSRFGGDEVDISGLQMAINC
jgi:hypothetical protein